jgi:Protein of unknown function (DUF3224)
MHAPHLRRLVTTIAIAAAATAVSGAGGALANAAASPMGGSPANRRVAVSAEFQAPPDVVTFAEPCSATNPVPAVGVCRGTSFGGATYTGTLQGTSSYQTAFTVSPAGVVYFVAMETFTGNVAGCGTGTMTSRSSGTISATGELRYQQQVVRGLGTDGLADVTGQGTVTGTYNADGTETGHLTGKLHCSRSH